MTNYKEFQGKTLDDAIQEACTYYGVEREKLEIDIINDAKTGIFGLVGVKKATIRAARVQQTTSVIHDEHGDVSEKKLTPKEKTENTTNKSQEPPSKSARSTNNKQKSGKPTQKSKDVAETISDSGRDTAVEAAVKPSKAPKPQVSEKNTSHLANKKSDASSKAHVETKGTELSAPQVADVLATTAQILFEEQQSDDDTLRDDLPDFAFDTCNQAEICALVVEIVGRLIFPIVGDVPCVAEITDNRLKVNIDSGDATGILVGREGQTLGAIQYLVARILAKKLGGAVRLQIDVGNYRERQDDKLRELALYLADKVKKTRRSQSTRPLSAYQRRIIHLALEGDEQLQTHSKGEGAQRRVIIQFKRGSAKRSEDQDSTASEPAGEND